MRKRIFLEGGFAPTPPTLGRFGNQGLLYFEISVIRGVRVTAVAHPLGPTHARVPRHFDEHALRRHRLQERQRHFAAQRVSLRERPLIVRGLADDGEASDGRHGEDRGGTRGNRGGNPDRSGRIWVPKMAPGRETERETPRGGFDEMGGWVGGCLYVRRHAQQGPLLPSNGQSGVERGDHKGVHV